MPFYGGQPNATDVAKIKAPIQAHYGQPDERINAGAPASHRALTAAGVTNESLMYPQANHGFHNDTTPRDAKPQRRK